jgi:tetratricopeptide (TPR) repeat protein
LCAELERLHGNLPQALADLQAIIIKTPILALEAMTLEAKIENDFSHFEHAERLFQEALATAKSMVGARMAHIQRGLSYLHYREDKFDAAWREAQLALYEAENMVGVVLERGCLYEEAEQHFHVALELARLLHDNDAIAKTSSNLSGLCARLGRFAEADRYQRQADEALAPLVIPSILELEKINWAFLYNLADQHDKALLLLQELLAFSRQQGLSLTTYQMALLEQGLAEAHLGLGNLAEAEEYVVRAIQAEEGDILPDAYRTHGEILLRRGDLPAACSAIQSSLDHLQEHPDPYLEGYAWRTLAQVYVAQANISAAVEAKQRAIALFAQMNLANEVEKTRRSLPGELG